MPHPPHPRPQDGPRNESVLLASASPRRQELLRAAGIRFKAIASNIPELMQAGETGEQFVRRMAVAKAEQVVATAEQVAAGRPGEAPLIVAADTVVLVNKPLVNKPLLDQPPVNQTLVNETVLGKPDSASSAASMLRLLSGRTHVVLTGLCVLEPSSGRRWVEAVRTQVRFGPLTEEEIQQYVATGEPLDKAGAYAIQGLASKFVEWIEGCYFNVVGLPVPTLYRLLKQVHACPSGEGTGHERPS